MAVSASACVVAAALTTAASAVADAAVVAAVAATPSGERRCSATTVSAAAARAPSLSTGAPYHGRLADFGRAPHCGPMTEKISSGQRFVLEIADGVPVRKNSGVTFVGPIGGTSGVDPTAGAYGADPTGVADSTAAINAAMVAAVASGARAVRLPAGVFQVAPTGADKVALRVPAGLLLLTGAGAELTVLRVAASIGDYKGIVEGAGDVGGLRIEGLTFDQNNTENQATGAGVMLGGLPRYLIHFNTASQPGVEVARCSFIDTDTVNVISVNGAAGDLRVTDCVFVVGDCPFEHDRSDIYSNPSGAQAGVWIERNTHPRGPVDAVPVADAALAC